MPYPESTDVAVDIWGGLNTSIPPSQLPSGASPACQDVSFPEAGVRTRDGLVSMFPPAAGFPKFNGLKTYTNGTLVSYLLAWDELGNLYRENPAGTLQLIASGGTPELFMNSTTIFGRQYMAFYSPYPGGIFNTSGGVDFPRQYDGVNFDRVSQCGVGAAPTVADSLVAGPGILASPTGLVPITSTGLTAAADGNLVTLLGNPTARIDGVLTPLNQVGDKIKVTVAAFPNYQGTFALVAVGLTFVQYVATTAPAAAEATGVAVEWGIVGIETSGVSSFGINIPGGTVTVQAATDATYDGTFSARAEATVGFGPINRVTYAYIPASLGVAASGGGNVVQGGNIPAGLRQMSVAFITRQGYITRPAPPTSWTAGGSLQATVTGIPTGPSNIKARLLLSTTAIIAPASTGIFFSVTEPVVVGGVTYSSAMLIQDNTTTSLTVDFRDTDLGAGFNGQYLFGLIELGECTGVTSYNSRTVWVGERNQLRNLVNLSFNGGWNGNLPLGWAGGGGTRAANGGVWLDAYKITGPGGMITQSAAGDFLGVPIFQLSTGYSIRVRAKTATGAGNLLVELFSPGSGSLAVATFPLANFDPSLFASGPYVEQIAVLTVGLATIPADTVLRVYTDAGVPAGQSVTIDSIEPFPTAAPVNTSIAWISYAFNPESFDGTLSQVQVRPNDGQALRAGFSIRGNLYLGKERYLASTTDDGQNEPSSWSVPEVSDKIGISGPNAVDTGEEWAAFANRNGAYLFWGSDPIKVSQEIQEDASKTGKVVWDSIDWTMGMSVWAQIDSEHKKIFFGVPLVPVGGGRSRMIWKMDYKFQGTGEEAAQAVGAAYSMFMNKLIQHGGGRKWAPWTIAANSCCLSERPDGTAKLFFGNSTGIGKIWQMTPGELSDDGAPINSFYVTSGQPSAQAEQEMQLRGHRKLCDYVTGHAIGAGNLLLFVESPKRTVQLRSVALSLAPVGDFERNANAHGERFFYMVGTNAVGSWFQMERLIPMLKPDPTMPVAGVY